MGKSKDIFGKAIRAYYENEDKTPISVESPDFEDDVIPVEYLFRSFSEMPALEQRALILCNGRTLDVGCGAGSHSLYLQDQRNLDYLAIDTSKGAIEVARERGLQNVECIDFFSLKNERFNTILMLMNGSGIIGRLENMPGFFKHCRTLLDPNGQIVLDSSDLIFLFDEEDFAASENYYGELEFKLSYKGETSSTFDWLYIDPERLIEEAKKNNFHCNIVQKGEHYDYLAVLKPF